MAEAKERHEWSRAAAIVCKIHNCHCTETIEPADVHPLLQPAKREPDVTMTMGELGDMLGHQWPGLVE